MEGQGSSGTAGSGGSTGTGGSGGSAGSDGGKRRRHSSDEESSTNKKSKVEAAEEEEQEQGEEEQVGGVMGEQEEEEEEVVGGVMGDPQIVMAAIVLMEYSGSMFDPTDDPITVSLTKQKTTQLLGVKGLDPDRTTYVLTENTQSWIPIYFECRRTNINGGMAYEVHGRDHLWNEWLKSLQADDDCYIVFRSREGNFITVVSRE